MIKIKVFLSALMFSMIFQGVSQAYTTDSKVVMFGIGPGGESPAGHPGENTTYETGATPFITALNFQYGIHEYISVGAYLSLSRATAHTKGRDESYYSNRDNLYYNWNNGGNWNNGFGNNTINNDYTQVWSESDRVRTTIYYGLKAEGHFSELIGLTDKIDLYSGLAFGMVSRSEKLKNGVSSTTIEYYDATNFNYDTNESTTEWESDYEPGDSPLDWNLFLGARYYFNEQLGAYLELGARYTYVQVGLSYKL